jgi:hypothetical protein
MKKKTKNNCIICMGSALILGVIVAIIYNFYLAQKPVVTAEEQSAVLQAEQSDPLPVRPVNHQEIIAPAPVVLSGRFELEDKYFDIKPLSSEKVSLGGYAEWYNAGGVIHIGEISGEASLVGNSARFVRPSDGCSLMIEFFTDKIKVTDNKKCGGLNVTFDGEYPRVK